MKTEVKSTSVAGKKLLLELKKIHPQWELAAAIFLSLRGRLERKLVESGDLEFDNRIGKAFPDGDISIIMLGDRGTRKTTLMKSIFNGLGLNGTSDNDEPMSHFVKSANAATSVGLFELFEDHPDKVLFIDEIDLDSSGHFGIFKQISNGEIFRQKHGGIDPVPFKSLVISATNSISMPKKRSDRQHLLAVLDRFYVMLAKPVETNVHNIIDNVIDGNFANQKVNWKYLTECLTRSNFNKIVENEKALVHAIWEEKEKYVLGSGRDQTRNIFKIVDTVLFFKRILGVEDVTQHKDIAAMIVKLIDAIILINPASIISLKDDLDELLYNAVSNNDDENGVRMSQILDTCSEHGMSINESQRRKIINRLDNLVMSSILTRPSKGRYSTKKIMIPKKKSDGSKVNKVKNSPLSGLL